MRNSLTAAFVLGMTLGWFDVAFAQPTLERVEEQVRREAELAPAKADEPGYLGIIADDRQEEGKGIRVMEVIDKGPASAAGLQIGDLITGINGKPVVTMDAMAKIIEESRVGTKLEFEVTRGDQQYKPVVTLGARPAASERRFQDFGRIAEDLPTPGLTGNAYALPNGVAGPSPKLGVRTMPLTEERRREYNLSDTTGAMVTAVMRGMPAEKAKIPLGVVITAVDGQPVRSPEELAQLIGQAKPGQEVEITYTQDSKPVTKRVTLNADTAPRAGGTEIGNGVVPPPPTPGLGIDPFAPGPVAPPAIPNAGAIRPGIDPRDARIQQLEERIKTLEERLEKLEATSTAK